MRSLDPDVEKLVAFVAGTSAAPMESLSPEEARASFAQMRDALFPECPPIAIESILSEDGVPIRLYRPLDRVEETLPTLIYLHGGGWVLGSVDLYDSFCSTLANEAGICLASVDYRLAPEAPFPAAFEDGLGATRWLHAHSRNLRVDPDHMAIGGDSAGAALAASVALAVRDSDGPTLSGLIMLYPVTDLVAEAPSYVDNASGYVLTAAAMRWFRDHYLLQRGDALDWRASPLRAASFADLPPTYVLTCGFDPLRDEGIAFALALEAARVPVTHRHLADQVHGFLMWGKAVPAANRILREVARSIRPLLRLPV